MKKLILSSLLVSAFGLLLSAAPNPAVFSASRTFEFDPDHTSGVSASWQKGVGLPDSSGNGNTGLRLEKSVATSTNASAGAVIDGLKGTVVQAGDMLGFDLRNDSACASGPRFNVSYTLPDGTSGFSFVGGCNNATKTPACQDPVNWTRDRLSLQNPAQAFPAIPVGSTIQSVVLIIDEQGIYTLDNISFRDQVATKPGSSTTTTGCP